MVGLLFGESKHWDGISEETLKRLAILSTSSSPSFAAIVCPSTERFAVAGSLGELVAGFVVVLIKLIGPPRFKAARRVSGKTTCQVAHVRAMPIAPFSLILHGRSMTDQCCGEPI